MLKIQEYLQSGNTLLDLYQHYEINANVCSNLGVVVFNYRMLAPLENTIVQEARGLVLELDTWEIAGKSINAFFEPENPLSEPIIQKFDWSTAKAMDKLDGALILMYFYKGEWRVATRFFADGNSTVWSANMPKGLPPITWRDLTIKAVTDQGISWEEFTSQLDSNIFYTFELIAPENRVVVVYDRRQLVLVAAIDKNTLEEIDIYGMNFPVSKAVYQNVSSLQDVYDLIEANSAPHEREGFVVIDKNFNRIKIRNPKFNELMRTFSIESEVSALSELRSWDVQAFSIGTGTMTGSIQSSVGGLALGPNILADVWGNYLIMSRYISDTYQIVKDLPDDEFKSTVAYQIWPQAMDYLRQGFSVSDMLDKSSEEDMMSALQRFKDLQK